jgi:hypothetical protein
MVTYNRPSPDVSRYCEERAFSSLVRKGGFDYLLDRWTKIVTHVETGYRASFDEYLNDMDARGIIDELATYASNDEWMSVEALLPSLDNRFRGATRPVGVCIWGERRAAKHRYNSDRDWWYFRVPMNLEHVRDRGYWP